MRNLHRKNIILLFLVLFSEGLFALIKLPKLISDGMVLQRNAKVHIWGWADPAEKISVSIDGKSYSTIATENGDWKLTLKPHAAGGPFSMQLIGNNKLEIKDILFGDVWLCSGQSNMELPMRRVKPLYEDILKNANNPSIRYFAVPQKYNFKQPEKDYVSGSWQSVTPATIQHFSAVCYFFGNQLFQQLHVPIGLINASLGGSPIQAWMSEAALNAFPDYKIEGVKFRDDNLIRKIEAADSDRNNAWYTEASRSDAGQRGIHWLQPQLNDSDWLSMSIPGYWNQTPLGNVNGVVWFRKEFNISKENSGKPAFLNLGRIVDADSAFVNGEFVGSVSYQYPPRWYHVPENVLKEGRNVIVVRVVSNSGNGGFVLDKPYNLKVENTSVDLKGTWKMKLGCEMNALPGQTFIRWKPMGLYNAMIAPLAQYTKNGIVWYQGESNTDNPKEYARLLPALINDWRTRFGQAKIPFLYAQLPNFLEAKPEPTESNWALLREAQLKALSVPNTAMAVTIDAGEWNDIHPLNKKIVGERLAKLASRNAGKTKIASAPTFLSMKISGNKIELKFMNNGNRLRSVDGKQLLEIAVAGSDRKFVWAKTQIKRNVIIVWNDTISHPVAVRYAWADNPDKANLIDTEGNFVSPFRTDDW